ncbi:MAG TPA: hypothetical protein ENK06_05265 [Gammaproteobacteria bacterium]|nr:hypothetical protein [Gammaproteobacteria bacterium]
MLRGCAECKVVSLQALKRLVVTVFFVIASCVIEASEIEDSIDFDESSFDVDIADLSDEAENKEKNWRLNFSWRNGIDLNALDNTRSHRFDTRLDWGTLLLNEYFLKFDGKAILRLPGDDNQSNQASSEWDWRLREFYLQDSLRQWTFTAGFQALSLGEMDAVQVVDLLAPWDYSEFAFTAPEDARLGQLLFNVEWHGVKSLWQFIYSPWPLSNRYPGGDAGSILRQLLGDQSFSIKDKQPKPLTDNEILLKWQSNIQGSDITLTYASLLNNDPVFHVTGDGVVRQFDTEYFRFNLFAFGANLSSGNFLWKFEAAYKQNMKYQPATQPVFTSNEIVVAFGLDYDANGAWRFTLETLNRRILASENHLRGLDKNSTQIVSRWSKNWLYETFSTVLFTSYQLQYGDIISSLAFDYMIDDHWQSRLVGSVFHSSDVKSPGQLTKNWDQLTLSVSYTF